MISRNPKNLKEAEAYQMLVYMELRVLYLERFANLLSKNKA